MQSDAGIKLRCLEAGGHPSFKANSIYDLTEKGGEKLVFPVSPQGNDYAYALPVVYLGNDEYRLNESDHSVVFRVASDIEIDMANVVAFPSKGEDAMDQVGLLHTEAQTCPHPNISVNEKERTCRCQRCGSVIEAFDYLLKVARRETTYASNINALSRQESTHRANIEKLVRIERNAKSRARRADPKTNAILDVLDYCERGAQYRPDIASFANMVIKILTREDK